MIDGGVGGVSPPLLRPSVEPTRSLAASDRANVKPTRWFLMVKHPTHARGEIANEAGTIRTQHKVLKGLKSYYNI